MMSSKETVEARIATCAGCDKSTDMSGNPLYFFVGAVGSLMPNAPKTMCAECSCPIWIKVRVAANTCPLGKWDKEE